MTKTTTETKTAKQAYADTAREIRRDIAILQNALDDHRLRHKGQPNNWGYVGDLSHVRELLQNIHSFLGVDTGDALHCDHADGCCREVIRQDLR
jgi:hypothetical protein